MIKLTAFTLIGLMLAISSNVVSARRGVRGVSSCDRQLEEELSFQLKMYWEDGYFWQESTEEVFWCAECEGDKCREGDVLHIKNCDDDDRQRFVFEEVPGTGGGRVKPLDNQDLCWTSLGANRGRFELQPCDDNCRQIIVGPAYAGRFEMQPLGRPMDCLEQHHHPKSGEVIRLNDCVAARKDTTSYWVMIEKEGDGLEEKEEEVLQGSEIITDQGTQFCTNENKCGLCMGHCESDADCRDGLACMKRFGNEYVPGCTDTDREKNSKLNVCYNRDGYTLPPTESPTNSTPALYGDCGAHVMPTNPPLTLPPPPNTTATTTTTTTTTTVAPTTTTTVAPTTTQQVQARGSCELDDEGFFGQEASRSPSVHYFYELVTDPAALADGNSSVNDIIGKVGQGVLALLLPTLFGDDCTDTESNGQRQLANAAEGVKNGPTFPGEGVTCNGDFSEDHDCTVVAGSMTVYTNGDENYDTLLLPVIQAAMNSGRLNDVDPAVFNVVYRQDAGESSSAAVSSSGMDDDTKVIIAASAGAAAFLVGIVALAVVATKFYRKKSSVTAVAEDDATTPPPIRPVKVPTGAPLNADNVKSEVQEWPGRTDLRTILGEHGPAEDDGSVQQPALPIRKISYNVENVYTV